MSSLHEPIQSMVEQDLGDEVSRYTVAVVSKSLLLRRSITSRLNLVGVTVFAHAHFDALFQGSHPPQPDIVLIDTTGQELPWKALVSLLKIFSGRSRAVLLAASMNVDQAMEAGASGVRAILIKPYKAEQHTGRILDLLLEAHRITPKRLQPRFSPVAEAELRVDYLPMDDWLLFPVLVDNISEKGAQLHMPYGEYAGEFQPGSSGFPATLAIGTARISLNLRVVHREGETVGVAFDGLGTGRRVLDSFIEDMRRQALGDGGSRRRW
jgi:FixJ family two-component response regulator